MSIEHVTSTGSTNADLLAAAAEGRPEGAVLVADHQTAGRGRQSRTWHDEPGNAVLMSVLLRPRVAVAAVVPFIAGLAVVDAVHGRTGLGSVPGAPKLVGLKWPNDVLTAVGPERKLAGILAEASTAGGARASDGLAVVVGIGLNLRWSRPPPDEIASTAASLEQVMNPAPERFRVVHTVLQEIERWLGRAEAGGTTAVLDPYRERCLTIGRRVCLDTPGGVVEGTASSIAPDGGLVVDTSTGPVTVTAGDAHHV